MDTRLILMRHGQTAWNVDGRFQGQRDIELNDVGRRQAAEAAPFVASLRPDRIVASPLGRARDTAAEVAALVGIEVEIDERIKEIHVGSWEGLVPREIGELDPEYARAVAERRDHRRSPTGETGTEVGLRVGGALRDIAARNAGLTTLVVSHGSAIRHGVGELLGGFAWSQQIGVLHNCHWSELLLRDDAWRLRSYDVGVLGPLISEPDY